MLEAIPAGVHLASLACPYVASMMSHHKVKGFLFSRQRKSPIVVTCHHGCSRCSCLIHLLCLHPLKEKMVRQGLAFAEGPWRLYPVEGSLLALFKGDPLELASLLGGPSWLGPCQKGRAGAGPALDLFPRLFLQLA